MEHNFESFKELISKEVPVDAYKHIAREWVEQCLDPTKTLEGEDEIAKIWVAREVDTPTYERTLAGIWNDVGCAAKAAPYVLHGLVAQLNMPDNLRFREQSDAERGLAAAFLDTEHCPGARGLSNDDITKLKAIRDRAPPPAPKP